MASISISVSTESESTINVAKLEHEGDCLSIHLNTNIMSCGEPHCFAKDWVAIHGSIADIRLLAQKMLAALPAETPTRLRLPGGRESNMTDAVAEQLWKDPDWTCPHCQFVNFAIRQKCRNCGYDSNAGEFPWYNPLPPYGGLPQEDAKC